MGEETEPRSSAKRTKVGSLKLVILGWVWILLLQVALIRKARRTQAHIFCANDLDTLLIAVCAAGFSGKVVYDSHERWTDMPITARPFFKKLLQFFERFLIRRVDAVMTVNEFIADVLAHRYSIKRPAYVYSCPANSRNVTQQKNKGKEFKVALYQGRHAPDRGLENLVRASQHLHHDIRLVFRGYGDVEKDIRVLADGRRTVQFDPPVPMEQLVDMARRADVGIVSYLPMNLCNYLASPNKLFEYIQAGIPIAASDMPFIRKVVRRNDLGQLFDPADPLSTAHAINEVTRAEDLKRHRGNFSLIAKKYSWDNESQKTDPDLCTSGAEASIRSSDSACALSRPF